MMLVATTAADVLSRLSEGLKNVDLMLTATNYISLREAIIHVKPDIVLLDFELPLLEGLRGIVALRKLNSQPRIVVMANGLSDDIEIQMFLAGVRGCCCRNLEPQQLHRVVSAVRRGELWIRRSVTLRLLNELGVQRANQMQIRRVEAGRFVELTQREQEIAALVSGGNSNKQIARRLAISESTVKAHLTEIFRKLGITDRLMLALHVMAHPVGIDRDQPG